jgi:hypothetical protein
MPPVTFRSAVAFLMVVVGLLIALSVIPVSAVVVGISVMVLAAIHFLP